MRTLIIGVRSWVAASENSRLTTWWLDTAITAVFACLLVVTVLLYFR